MSRFVPVYYGLGRQRLEQFLVGAVQSVTELGYDLGQLAARDGHSDHVTQKLANGGKGSVGETLEVSNQSGQAWSNKATFADVFWQGSLVVVFAVDAPVFGTGVLLDGQLRR